MKNGKDYNMSCILVAVLWMLVSIESQVANEFNLENPNGHNKEQNDLLISQKSNSTVKINSYLSLNISKYYKYINLASRAIYSNNFNLASNYYDSAFIYHQHPFYEDLINSIIVNSKCGHQNDNVIAINHLLKNKGINTSNLFQLIPKNLFTDKDLKLINSIQINEIKPLYKDFIESLREIYFSDQYIRDYKSIDKEARKALYNKRDSVDMVNFVNFQKLYRKYGFPSENKVGVFFDNESKWIDVIYVLLLHFIQNSDELTINPIIEIIKEATYSGAYPSSKAASLLDLLDLNNGTRVNAYNFLSTTLFLVDGEPYRPFIIYSDSLMKSINTRRLTIGLDSFQVSQKQVVCQFYGTKQLENKKLILMAPYAEIAELPYSLVKRSAEEVNIDLNNYKINTTKILDECSCQEKVY